MSNLRLFQTERVYRHNFKFDENGDRSPKGIENTVGRGEIAHYEQFLLLPQCFQRLVLQACKNKGLFGKGLRLQTHGGKCFFFFKDLVCSVVKTQSCSANISDMRSCSSLAAEPHSSVVCVADLRTGDRWFDPLLCQYPFRGL